MPYASMSGLPVKPSSFSTASSTGRPWQSQPAIRGDVVALHRLEAGEDVLEHPGLDVVGAGHAVRGRRALVERPGRAVGGLREAALEDPSGRASVSMTSWSIAGEVDVRRQGPRSRSVTLRRSFESSRTRGTTPAGRGAAVPPSLTRLAARPLRSASGSTGAWCPFFRCSEVISRRAGPRAPTVPGSLLDRCSAATCPRRRTLQGSGRRIANWPRTGAGTWILRARTRILAAFAGARCSCSLQRDVVRSN